MTDTKFTPSGNRYGTRRFQFRTVYIPSLKDNDVAQYILRARDRGVNITQLITDAIRMKMKKEAIK